MSATFNLGDVQSEIDDLVALYEKLKADDGKISLSDMWQIFQVAIADLADLANQLNVPNDQKKVLILAALGDVFDKVLAGVQVKFIPPILIPIFDKVAKELFLSLATGVLNNLFPTTVNMVFDPVTKLATVPSKP